MSRFDELRQAAEKEQEHRKKFASFVDKFAAGMADYLGCTQGQVYHIFLVDRGGDWVAGFRQRLGSGNGGPSIHFDRDHTDFALGIALMENRAAGLYFSAEPRLGVSVHLTISDYGEQEKRLGPFMIRTDSPATWPDVFENAHKLLLTNILSGF